MTYRRTKCEMINAHHPDCTCQWCKAHLDEMCSEPAVGTVNTIRVCEECAIGSHREGFQVSYDDNRTGVAS